MSLLKKYWYFFVFIGLTGKVLHDNPNLISFASRPIIISAPYGIWPTTKYKDTTALKAANKQEEVIQFRGNVERQGWIEGHLGESYAELWRFENFNRQIHDAAKGSAVADDSGIYIGSDMGWFYCFDFDGKIKWRIYNELALKGVHGTPIIDGDFLFYGDYAGYLHAVNKKTGEILWQRFLGVTLGASPLVLGDFIYANIELAPADGYIAKLNKHSGEMVFKSHLIGEQSHSSPAYDDKHHQIIFGTNNNIFRSIDTETGTFGWSYMAKDKVKSTPVLYQGKAYYTDWSPHLSANNSQTGMLEFSVPLKSRTNSSPALLKNTIVAMDKHQLYQISLDGRLLKKLDVHNTSHIGSPLVVRDGNKESLLFICNDKDLCRTDASLNNLKVLYKGTRLISTVPFLYRNLVISAENDGALIVLKAK